MNGIRLLLTANMMLGSKGLLPPNDATDCSVSSKLPQSYDHSQSADFPVNSGKSLLAHVRAGPKVMPRFMQA